MAVRAGESVGVTLDEQIFVERGEIRQPDEQPADAHQRLPRPHILARQRTRWCRAPVYKMKLCTGEYQVEVEKIEKVIDIQDLGIQRHRTTSNATPSPRWSCVRAG